MAPSLEQGLIASIRTGDRGRTLGIEAPVAESLVRQVAKLSQEAESRGITPVLLSRPASAWLFGACSSRASLVWPSSLRAR